jgi:hypothetical protein
MFFQYDWLQSSMYKKVKYTKKNFTSFFGMKGELFPWQRMRTIWDSKTSSRILNESSNKF